MTIELKYGTNLPLCALKEKGSMENVRNVVGYTLTIVPISYSSSPSEFCRAIKHLCLALDGNGRAENAAALMAESLAEAYAEWCGGITDLGSLGMQIIKFAQEKYND